MHGKPPEVPACVQEVIAGAVVTEKSCYRYSPGRRMRMVKSGTVHMIEAVVDNMQSMEPVVDNM
jgi:hypothetical protein